VPALCGGAGGVLCVRFNAAGKPAAGRWIRRGCRAGLADRLEASCRVPEEKGVAARLLCGNSTPQPTKARAIAFLACEFALVSAVGVSPCKAQAQGPCSCYDYSGVSDCGDSGARRCWHRPCLVTGSDGKSVVRWRIVLLRCHRCGSRAFRQAGGASEGD